MNKGMWKEYINRKTLFVVASTDVRWAMQCPHKTRNMAKIFNASNTRSRSLAIGVSYRAGLVYATNVGLFSPDIAKVRISRDKTAVKSHMETFVTKNVGEVVGWHNIC